MYIWEVAKLTRAGFFTLWHSRPVVRFFRLWQGCGQPWPAHPPARPSQMGSFLAWGSIWTSRHSKKMCNTNFVTIWLGCYSLLEEPFYRFCRFCCLFVDFGPKCAEMMTFERKNVRES